MVEKLVKAGSAVSSKGDGDVLNPKNYGPPPTCHGDLATPTLRKIGKEERPGLTPGRRKDLISQLGYWLKYMVLALIRGA